MLSEISKGISINCTSQGRPSSKWIKRGKHEMTKKAEMKNDREEKVKKKKRKMKDENRIGKKRKGTK